MRLVLLCIGLTLLSAPLEAQKRPRRCTGTAIDTLAPGPRVYRDCEVDRVARMRGTPSRLQWSPMGGGSLASCYRAKFEFVVDMLGMPVMATMTRISSTDSNFEQAVLAQIGTLRYEPAQLGGQRVRQLVVYEGKAAVRGSNVGVPGGSPSRNSAPSSC